MAHLPSQKLFFPNPVVKLVRSALPPHQSMFRVPPHMNKLDIHNYLTALYGLAITDIRTMNYLPVPPRGRGVRGNARAAYKKVIVTQGAGPLVFARSAPGPGQERRGGEPKGQTPAAADFEWPAPPRAGAGGTVEAAAAVLPQSLRATGRNSGNRYRSWLEQFRKPDDPAPPPKTF